jgi:hypothetical protein
VNKEEQFQVMNTYIIKTVFPGSNISFNKENKSDSINTNTIEDENNISALPIIESKEGEPEVAGKEKYSATFEQIFCKKAKDTTSRRQHSYFRFNDANVNVDLGMLLAKGREHFLKENSEARIDFLEQENKNTLFSQGHII